ncbi:MAG: signal recognition particle protein [Candidatus Odinarchaeota archaeon]|nr:signal recognition particle protein [Candidatus Odinarchaeota archaeon]
MVLDSLSNMLVDAINKLKKYILVDRRAIELLVKDIQRALLQSDVDVKLVLEISERIKKRALEEELPPGISKREYIIKIVYEELTKLLGGGKVKDYVIKKRPYIIMLVGIQGSGKTTSAVKLANYFQKRGFKVGLVCADTYRAGAFQQISQLAEKVNIPVYGFSDRKISSIEIAKDGIDYFKKQNFDVIIIDTAGRHKDEKGLMSEMHEMAKEIKPSEIMLVIDGTIGQQAFSQAKAFKETTGDIGTIFVTKLDGTARGGGALSAVSAIGAPIAFIGTGEHIDDIELFNPSKFVGRLLGIPDIEQLIQKVKEAKIAVSKEKTLKMLKGKFTLVDFYEQINNISKLGPMDKVLQYMGIKQKLPSNLDSIAKEKLKKWKVIIQSMTFDELANPQIIDSSRVNRIARGSGTTPRDVKELLKQYRQMKTMLKRFGKKGVRLSKLYKNLQLKI